MVRLTGNMATNFGVAICGGTAIYFPTSVNATETTAAGCGTADTSNSSGVFQCLTLAANKYDIRVNCGSAFRWFRYADEIQHATYQTGDGCSSGREGNYYVGIGNDAGIRWSIADISNHALVLGVGNTSQQLHITDEAAMNTDWVRCAGTHPELAIHSNTTPATDYLALGNHDGTDTFINAVGATNLNLQIAGATTVQIDATSLTLPTDDDFLGLGASDDVQLLWSTGDPSNHALVLALGASQQLHITDVGAKATDWIRCAATHPEILIHSNTTPATDYLLLGNHNGTSAEIDVVGGSLLRFRTSGNTKGHIDGCGVCVVTGNFYSINNVSVLNATTLGGAVVASSLTSVGTLTALTMGGAIVMTDNNKLTFGTSSDYDQQYVSASNYLALATTNSDGCGANADVWRILDGQLSIDANTTWDDNVFDDYDDALVLKRAFSAEDRSPMLVGRDLMRSQKSELIAMGVIREYKRPCGETCPDFLGYNDQRMSALLAGGIYQNRAKIDGLEQRLERLEENV